MANLRKHPWVTYSLCGICIIVYLFECYYARSFNIDAVTLFHFGAVFTPWEFDLTTKLYELPRLFLAMFVHMTPMHIFSNMAFLIIIGRLLEPIFGHIRFLLLYLCSGIVGDMLALRFSKPYTLTAGASTALFGILVAGILLPFLLHEPELKSFAQSMFGLLITNVIVGFLTPSISLLGHLGGAIGGVIFGYLLRPRLLNVRFTKLTWQLLFSTLAMLIIILIFV